MFAKSKELIDIINKKIENNYKDIGEKQKSNKELIDLYNKIVDDDNALIYTKNSVLKKVTDQFDIKNKEEIYKDILTIKNILKMNKEYSSTLRLFKKNKQSLQTFLDNFNILNDKLKEKDPKIDKINNEIDDYKKLIDTLENNKFKLTKKNKKLIEKAFEDNSNNNDILVELIKFEKEEYDYKISKSIKKEKINVSEEDLKQVFKKYNYNLNELEVDYKSLLMIKGNLNNIDEVFSSLESNEYPIINNNYVLTSLLLGSDSKTINRVTEFSKENHLIPKSLLDISGALLKQRDYDEKEGSYIIVGSSLDFMRNIVTLKEAGLSVNYIFQECKAILTMPNELLKKNIDLFYKYGFSFNYKRKGIIDPSPAALLSTQFAKICDAFIEIHPLGLKYITDNLSNLKTVSNPDSLMFYNIYQSEKDGSGDINDPENGPFRAVLEDNNENYQLKAKITRNKPEYKDTYYKNITEENKHEVTETIKIDIKGMSKFNKIIDNNIEDYIPTNIFNNEYIESLDKYIDNNSPLVYNFKNKRISRLKVLRIYSTLLRNGIEDSIDSLMYAITYNSILSEEDYNNILDIVKKEIENR